MESLSVIQQINLTPSLAFYAASLGYDPNRCKMEVQFRKAKIHEKTFLQVEYVQNIVVYSPAPDNEGGEVEVSEVVYCDPIKRQIKMFIHNDLENAFKMLTAHVLFITGLVKNCYYNAIQEMQFETIGENHEPIFTSFEQQDVPGDGNEYSLLNRVNVLGVDFSGFGDNESISIVCKIKSPLGKEFPIKVPLVKIDNIDEEYFFTKDLNTAVENLKKELIAYMYFGKVGEVENNQLELFNEHQD